LANEAGILFHSDGVQAVGKIPVDVKDLGVDYMTISCHKIYGPKGIGALYVRRGSPIDSLIKGGHQEKGLRAGTYNAPSIIAFGKAAELARENLNAYMKHTESLRQRFIKKMKELEFEGYQFEGADGSFELLVRKITGSYKPFFTLRYYKTVGEQPRVDKDLCSFVQIKIEVDGQIEVTAGEGDGPVHALDTALRKALERFYPCVNTMRLIDYKVRVLDSKSAAAAKVRVLIESASGSEVWTTVGVSSDIVEASWLALVDSFEYKLIRDAAALELQKNKI